MKEDLAEWLNTLYPDLMINAENFMDCLDTGVALCKHANCVREAAESYLARRQARNKSMTRSMTSALASPILAMGNVHYLPAAKSGTFFARDNVSNFIAWCRKSLQIIECLLFETDDLILRKNEKHVILCLLEVGRRGAKLGMLAPMLVQMELQIDREIAAEQRATAIGWATQRWNNEALTEKRVTTEMNMLDSDSDIDDEEDTTPMLMYEQKAQIITNDLKRLDEMVRDLAEKCTCPSQFPMVRVSEGKYRIGETKVLIFVRILRSHVMVRVGGGWDTLSHYLDKHDPCRCRSQHRSSTGARLIQRNSNNQSNCIELHKAQVIFERSPPAARKIIASSNNQAAHVFPTTSSQNNNPKRYQNKGLHPSHSIYKNRNSSPTSQRNFCNQLHHTQQIRSSTFIPNNGSITITDSNNTFPSPNLQRRSMSPSSHHLRQMQKKQTPQDTFNIPSGPQSLPIMSVAHGISNNVQFDSINLTQLQNCKHKIHTLSNVTTSESKVNGKHGNISDNGSEISDEGYRSLGFIYPYAQKRESLQRQVSLEGVERIARLDKAPRDSLLSPSDVEMKSNKTLEQEVEAILPSSFDDSGPHSLPILLSTSGTEIENDFKNLQTAVHSPDKKKIIETACAKNLPSSQFSNKICAIEGQQELKTLCEGETLNYQMVKGRGRNVNKGKCTNLSGSLLDLNTEMKLSNSNYKNTEHRHQPKLGMKNQAKSIESNIRSPLSSPLNRPKPSDGLHTLSSTSSTSTISKKRFSGSTSQLKLQPHNVSERNRRTRSTKILYDNNGRRIRSCTTSLTTSPVKDQSASPLGQQFVEAASDAKTDQQILAKMKTLLTQYSNIN